MCPAPCRDSYVLGLGYQGVRDGLSWKLTGTRIRISGLAACTQQEGPSKEQDAKKIGRNPDTDSGKEQSGLRWAGDGGWGEGQRQMKNILLSEKTVENPNVPL